MNDRRHELETNELAVYLDKANRQIEPYSKLIAAVVAALLIGGLIWAFVSNQAVEVRSDSTLELLQASGSSDPEVFDAVTSRFPDTLSARWASLYQGNEYLGQGIEALYNDRENAEQLLGDARTALEASLDGASDPLLQSRANFALARTAEAGGDIDEAITFYQQVESIAESDSMVEVAQQRIASLSSDESKDFLAWFEQQDFAPADPSLPPSLPNDGALPDEPDMSLPGLDLGDLNLSDEPQDESQEQAMKDDAEEPAAETTDDNATAVVSDSNESDTEDTAEDTDAPADADVVGE